MKLLWCGKVWLPKITILACSACLFLHFCFPAFGKLRKQYEDHILGCQIRHRDSPTHNRVWDKGSNRVFSHGGTITIANTHRSFEVKTLHLVLPSTPGSSILFLSWISSSMAPSSIDSTSRGEKSGNAAPQYSTVNEANIQFQILLSDTSLKLPEALNYHAKHVVFTASPYAELPLFPCPFKQMEAVAILKALESSIAAAIADLRYGAQKRKIVVSLEKCARYLMSAYICTVDGMGKLDPNVKPKLKSMTSLFEIPSFAGLSLIRTEIPI